MNCSYLKSTGRKAGLWESVSWNLKDLATSTQFAAMKVEENNIIFSETEYAHFLC